MIALGEDWSLFQWYCWLDNLGMELGHDYRWGWHDGFWAIEVDNPETELMLLLSAPKGLIWITE